MNNEQVDIIMIICFVLGLMIGLAVYSYGYYIYNFIFYSFVMVGIFFCLYKYYLSFN